MEEKIPIPLVPVVHLQECLQHAGTKRGRGYRFCIFIYLNMEDLGLKETIASVSNHITGIEARSDGQRVEPCGRVEVSDKWDNKI